MERGWVIGVDTSEATLFATTNALKAAGDISVDVGNQVCDAVTRPVGVVTKEPSK